MHRQVQSMGHLVLDFGRVLGGRVHNNIAVVLGQRQGGLAFQIEMLLPAQFQCALDLMRGFINGLVHVAPGPNARAFFEAAVGC